MVRGGGGGGGGGWHEVRQGTSLWGKLRFSVLVSKFAPRSVFAQFGAFPGPCASSGAAAARYCRESVSVFVTSAHLPSLRTEKLVVGVCELDLSAKKGIF